MPSAKLTKGFVDTAKPLHGKPQTLFWDTELKGFGLLVGRSAKSFVVQRSGGRRRTIGRYPVITVAQARQRALEVLAAIGNGTADEGLPVITLIQAGDLHRKRMIRKGCAERSLEDIDYRLNRYLADWLDRPLGEIERTEVSRRHNRIGKTAGPYMANSVFRTFRAIYNTALRSFDLPRNPCVAVDWYPEQRRQEPVEDLPAWYEEVRRTINPIRRAYQLFVLFTGLRRTDAATIRWEDVDWSAGTLHRPEPKGGKGRAFTIPLSRRAIAILRYLRIAGRKIHPGEPWVFPTRKLNGSIGPLSEPKEQRLINGRKVNRLPSPHRLRDTYVTACAEVGLHDFDIKVLVNHRLPGGDVTAGYVRQNSDHLRQCQERVAKHLSEKLRDRR